MNLKYTYQNKKIFITGHTGFKGTWLTQWLHWLGATIKGYALPPNTPDDIFLQIGLDKQINSITGDIRDKEKLKQEIHNFQPDFIFHLAAQPLVRYSYKEPIATFETNVLGTAHLLDAIRTLDNPCSLIIITTDKVYHNNEWEYPYREKDPLGGFDPYSSSKACTELVVDSYRNSFFPIHEFSKHQKSIAVARAGNVIGGGDWCQDRLLPDIIKALSNDQEIVVRNPSSIRPWQWVLEPLYGYLLLGAYLQKDSIRYSTAFNFGPNIADMMTVEQVVKQAIKIWGKGKFMVPELNHQPHEAGILKLDISKAKAYLDWEPKINAHQAIEMTIAWYKKYASKEEKNMRHITIEQIEYYQNLGYHGTSIST